MTEKAREAMDRLREDAEAMNRRRADQFKNHDPARDAEGRVLVTVGIGNVDRTSLDEAPYTIALLSESASGGPVEEIGYMSLTPLGAQLKLDKICVRGYVEAARERPGYGTGAMRRLIEMARAAGYSEIVGEARADIPERQERLRAWYRWVGFTVGPDDAISYDLSKLFLR